jgi:tetratricopeptide (TPR) repeat protein
MLIANIDSVQELLNKAYLSWNEGDSASAEQLCQKVLADIPNQPDALHLMGIIAHATQRPDLAIDYLRQACQSPIAPAQYYTNLAEILRQQGQLAEAKVCGQQALALDESLPSALFNYGRILYDLKEFKESSLYFRRAIALDPDNAQSYFYLAHSDMAYGRLKEVEENFLKAIEKDPNFAMCYSSLGVFYFNSLLYSKALEYSHKALDLDPTIAEAYLNIAEIKFDRFNVKQALIWVDALLEFDPLNVRALNNRALIYARIERFDDAFASVNLALNTKPNDVMSLNAKGYIFETMGKPAEAIATFERAVSIGEIASNVSISRLGQVHVQEGRIAEGLALFNQAIEKNPRNINAWRGLADIVQFQAGDANISKIESLLDPQAGLFAKEVMSLHFTLGKAYLDTGDSSTAFHHLNLANQMKRSTAFFDHEEYAKRIKKFTEIFTADFIEQYQSQLNSPLSHTPIFVLGLPRSGTTLLEQILSSHPMVRGAGELNFISMLTEEIEDYPLIPPSFNSTEAEALGQIYIDKIAPLLEGRERLVDKMPGNFLHAGLIHTILPHAKIIHSRRNAVDTCLSLYTKHFGGAHFYCYDMTDLGNYYQSYMALMAHWREVLPASHFLEVDYENVVDDIETQTRRILDYLGLPWDPACLDFYKTKRTVRTASVNQVRKPIYSSSSGRWKKHAEQLQPLIDALGPYGA